MIETLRIDSLGHRGEGVARRQTGERVFVPLTLPGETVRAEIAGERGTLIEIVTPAPERAEPFCAHFGACGGCQLQHLSRPAYEAFKAGLILAPLRQQGIKAEIARFVDAGGEGRRRATLHARKEGAGYMRPRSHEVADLDACPILVPALARAPAIARAVYAAIGESDVAFTATLDGLDIAIRAPRARARGERLMALFARFAPARLALNGEVLAQAATPRIRMGRAELALPVGGFLQASAAAETVLADYVTAAAGKARRAADLFCGAGPFALRLAETMAVDAFDSARDSIAALDGAARMTKGLKPLKARARDLFREPLTRFELDHDLVVLDPPRAGAEAQTREIAASRLKTAVMISCDPASFARDAAILVAAGFALENLWAVDQFVHSTHIEIAATFRR